jgi:hypothetical protein
MPGIELIKTFLQQANASGSRSTALNPLGWALAMFLSALITAAIKHAPAWVTILLAIFTATFFLAYLASYGFLLLKDRDALRSERFTLSKLAIERSIMGDNLTGFLDPQKNPLTLPTIQPKEGAE